MESLNRTSFVKALRAICNINGKVEFERGREVNLNSDDFERHVEKTIQILEAYDEGLKKEREAKPLVCVFLEELKKKGTAIASFNIRSKNGNMTFDYSQLPFLKDSELMSEYVVVTHSLERKYGSFGSDSYICVMEVEEAEKYDNVRYKPE